MLFRSVIVRSGSFFKYEEDVIGQGREAAAAALMENKKLAKEIFAKVKVEQKSEHKSKKRK